MAGLEVASEMGPRNFSIRSMMVATFVVSWALAVNGWLGDGYGWRTAIACGIFGIVVLLVDFRTVLGLLIGSLALSLIAYLFIIEHQPPSPQFYKAMIVMASYGAAGGVGVHAIVLGKRRAGAFALVLAVAAFAAILYLN